MAAPGRPTTPRAQGSEPPLPRRDSTEDADTSVTRKRPRLDGEEAACKTSTLDMSEFKAGVGSPPEHATNTSAIQQEQPAVLPLTPEKQVTINVRPQSAPSTARSSVNVNELEPVPEMEKSAVRERMDSLTSSPPVEVVDPEPPEEDNGSIHIVEVEGSPRHGRDARQVTDEFPKLRNSSRMGSLELYEHFLKTVPSLHITWLEKVTYWLEDVLAVEDAEDRIVMFNHQPKFWITFGSMTFHLLQRRRRLSDLGTEPDEADVVIAYLNHCVRLMSRLLEADAIAYDQMETPTLLSGPYFKSLSELLGPNTGPPIYEVLQAECQTDLRNLRESLIRTFLATAGLECLVHFLTATFEHIDSCDMNIGLTMIANLVSFIEQPGSSIVAESASSYLAPLLKLCQRIHAELHTVGKIQPVDENRNTLLTTARVLRSVLRQHSSLIANSIFAHLPGSWSDIADHHLRADVVIFAWKFNLFKFYLAKGKMELRVSSIEAMNQELIEAWRLKNSPYKTELVKYIANFLVEEKVIDYIFCADSHPQLIARSSNVVGFLLVSDHYTARQTDVIWQSGMKSADPRAVVATITMLGEILQYTNLTQLLYFCTKFLELPIESYTREMVGVSRHVSQWIMRKKPDLVNNPDKMELYRLFVRLVRSASTRTNDSKVFKVIFDEATQELKRIAAQGDMFDRRAVYKDCVEDITQRNISAVGSIGVIMILLENNVAGELAFLSEELGLTAALAEELCAFLSTATESLTLTNSLEPRLHLLARLISNQPQSLPENMDAHLWDHLVGRSAPNDKARDLSWRCFASVLAGTNTQNATMSRWLQQHVPNMEPLSMTLGCSEFLRQLVLYSGRLEPSHVDSADIVGFPSRDVLWRVILDAPDNSIEGETARLLASQYLDTTLMSSIARDILDNTHERLVADCISRLRNAHSIIQSMSDDSAASNPDLMVVDGIESSLQHSRRVFMRVLLFLKELLNLVQFRPEWTTPTKSYEMLSQAAAGLTKGDLVKIRYQVINGPSAEYQTLQVGDLETLQQLEAHLVEISGFPSLTIYVSGARLDVERFGGNTIREYRLLEKGALLVHRNKRSGGLRVVELSQPPHSVVQDTAWRHFDELYQLMDADDMLSRMVFELLSLLPPHPSILMMSSTSEDDSKIFSPGKPYRWLYALWTLQLSLRKALSQGELEDVFLARGVQLLRDALLQPQLLDVSLASPVQNQVAKTMIDTLLHFLRERPSEDVSKSYFPNGQAFVDRVLSVIQTCLRAPEKARLLCNCYAVLMEACLRSNDVWQAWIDSEKQLELHQMLLLEAPEEVRMTVHDRILSICDPVTQSTPLKPIKPSQYYRELLSELLPAAANHSRRSGQYFAVFEQAFRHSNEYCRDEEDLRACLKAWSALFLQYQHTEYVGNEGPDQFVIGMATLLRRCVQSLKSLKKPLKAEYIITDIASLYLFPPLTEDSSNAKPPAKCPILYHATRKPLYDLVFALCDSLEAYERVVAMLDGVVVLDETTTRLLQYDREDVLRSSAGFAGMSNLSNTCYQNSLLSQLYMNLPFRRFMLSLDAADSLTTRVLLRETQKMFTSLQSSFRKFFDTNAFASSIKDQDGLALNPAVQMDVDEFYNLLFDRWEAQMKTAAEKETFRRFYGGHTVNQIKSRDCDHVSERVEDFFVIQCDVKGKATLHDSLQSFVEGDLMEGDNKYKCESCGGRFVNAVKRTCLKDVPDNLILHLKRFDFDLMTMTRSKINDHFEFPETLDVSPYRIDAFTSPDVQQPADMFRLVGVLIHAGTAEQGHYYSHVRDQSTPDSRRWYEFNDTEVRELDPSTIKDSGFGGLSDRFNTMGQPLSKHYNAYMLFYQRVEPMQPTAPLESSTYASSLASEIALENETVLREFCVFDSVLADFLVEFLDKLQCAKTDSGSCSHDHLFESRVITMLCRYLQSIIGRAKDAQQLEKLHERLRRYNDKCAACWSHVVRWGCASGMRQMLVGAPFARSRSVARQLMITALETMRAAAPEVYNIEVDDGSSKLDPNGALWATLSCLRGLEHELAANTRAWSEYHGLLLEINNLDDGGNETAALLQAGFLYHTILFLVIERVAPQYLPDTNLQPPPRNVNRRLNYGPAIELLNALLKHVDLNIVVPSRPPLPYDLPSKFPLLDSECDLIRLRDREKCLALVGAIIERWDSPKATIEEPDLIIGYLLDVDTSLRTWRNYIEGIQQTIVGGYNFIDGSTYAKYLYAATSFCMQVNSTTRIMLVIKETAKQIETCNTAVTDGADAPHLDNIGEAPIKFFNYLANHCSDVIATTSSIHPEFIVLTIMQMAPCWVPRMLQYSEDRLSAGTSEVMYRLLQRFPSLTTADEGAMKVVVAAVRELLKTLVKTLDDAVEASIHETLLLQTIQVLRYSTAWLKEFQLSDYDHLKQSNDAPLIHKCIETAENYEQWPTGDDEELIGTDDYVSDDQFSVDEPEL